MEHSLVAFAAYKLQRILKINHAKYQTYNHLLSRLILVLILPRRIPILFLRWRLVLVHRSTGDLARLAATSSE